MFDRLEQQQLFGSVQMPSAYATGALEHGLQKAVTSLLVQAHRVFRICARVVYRHSFGHGDPSSPSCGWPLARQPSGASVVSVRDRAVGVE
jgi:hypothetical protein